MHNGGRKGYLTSLGKGVALGGGGMVGRGGMSQKRINAWSEEPRKRECREQGKDSPSRRKSLCKGAKVEENVPLGK